MTTQVSMERIFERVQMVPGKGDRSTGDLCVMSFVALLAGEGHSDSPKSASPLIRRFAISLNDTMSHIDRQRLKLFAPRILGTNDGLDAERGRLINRIVADEIIPKVWSDLNNEWLPRQFAADWPSTSRAIPTSQNDVFLEYVDRTFSASGQIDNVKLAEMAAKLLVTCARAATPSGEDDWYWSKAIDLLDRLCDVGAGSQAVVLSPDQLARVRDTLDRVQLDDAALLVSRILRRARRWLHFDTPALLAASTVPPEAVLPPPLNQSAPAAAPGQPANPETTSA